MEGEIIKEFRKTSEEAWKNIGKMEKLRIHGLALMKGEMSWRHPFALSETCLPGFDQQRSSIRSATTHCI